MNPIPGKIPHRKGEIKKRAKPPISRLATWGGTTQAEAMKRLRERSAELNAKWGIPRIYRNPSAK